MENLTITKDWHLAVQSFDSSNYIYIFCAFSPDGEHTVMDVEFNYKNGDLDVDVWNQRNPASLEYNTFKQLLIDFADNKSDYAWLVLALK